MPESESEGLSLRHPPSGAEVDVSIVLPVHNEAGHLEAEIDRICETMTDFGVFMGAAHRR